MSDLVKLQLSGAELLTVDVDGKPHIVFRPAVESIGLDYSTQLAKLRSRSWANRRDIPTVAADGKSRLMTVVDETTFLMWLATVNEQRVAEEVRGVLVSYQKESATAIKGYWTEGGTVNPRATEEQLSDIVSKAEAHLRLFQLAKGLVDDDWLQAKARHALARALGEEPEVNPDDRPLSVGEFLEEQGVTGAKQRSIASTYGKRVLKLYRERHGGKSPEKVDRFVDGALRSVNGYTYRDRDLFVEAWRQTLAATPKS